MNFVNGLAIHTNIINILGSGLLKMEYQYVKMKVGNCDNLKNFKLILQLINIFR